MDNLFGIGLQRILVAILLAGQSNDAPPPFCPTEKIADGVCRKPTPHRFVHVGMACNDWSQMLSPVMLSNLAGLACCFLLSMHRHCSKLQVQ